MDVALSTALHSVTVDCDIGHYTGYIDTRRGRKCVCIASEQIYFQTDRVVICRYCIVLTTWPYIKIKHFSFGLMIPNISGVLRVRSMTIFE